VNTALAQKLGVGLAACLLLAGCTSASPAGTSGASATDTSPASVTGTLRVLTPSYPTSNDGKAALQKVVDAFNKTYPKVTVEPDITTFGQLNEKISTSLASGQPYDVYITGVGWIPPFASKGLYADLATYGVNKDSLSKEVNPAIIQAGLFNSKVYGLPLIVSPKPIAYRKSLFTAAGLDPNTPPTSWDALRAAAKKLTKRDASGTLVQSGFDFWAPPGNYRQDFVTFLGSNGAAQYTDAGQPNFNTPVGLEALSTMTGMINDDKVTDFGAVSSNAQPLVLTGGAAMGFVGAYVDCAALGQQTCGDLGFFNIKQKQAAMFTGGQLASIGANTKLGPAAYAFIQLLTSADSEADIAKLNLAVPAATAAVDSAQVKSDPASQFSAAHLSEAVYEGGNAGWLQTRDAFGPALDKVILGQSTPEAALAELAKSGT
jgi:multiple sugar transport system substrate-binding protein